MDDIQALCERVIIIDHGRIIYDGRLAQIVERYADHRLLTASFKEPILAESLAEIGQVDEYDPLRAVIRVPRAETTARSAMLLNHFPVADLTIEEIPVEDIIRRIFAGATSAIEYITYRWRASLARRWTYRGSLAVWMFGVVATSYVSLAVWLAALGDKASIGAFNRSGLVQYYLSSALIAMLTSAWAVYWVSESIRMGGLNQHLLKPWSFLHFHIINNIGEKAIKLTVLLPMFAVIAMAFKNDWYWAMSWWQALLLPATVIMGAAIALLINICVGLLSFWVVEVAGMWTLYRSLESLLSGRLIPLALFPASWQNLLWLSPFRYTLSLPLELIVGQLDAQQTLISVGLQIAWLIVAYLLYRLLWRAGIRSYQAVGG